MGSTLRCNYQWKFIQSHSFPRSAAKEEFEERRSSNNFLTQLLYVKEARGVEFTVAAQNIN